MPAIPATKRVLVVDDHDAVRRGIRSLLDLHSNFTVCGEATDGVEAIEKTRLLQPDVVLMDVSMPRMDGLEATKAIREHFPETEFIVISQNDSALLASRSLSAGAFAFIGKFNLGRDLIPTLETISANSKNPFRKPAADTCGTTPNWPPGGELAQLIRATDWAQTPLGPVETWSPALRMMVTFLLANRFPLLLWWGPEYIQIYNDAYRPITGVKHPDRALGVSVRECWQEIWHILKPLIDTPFHGGPATWIEDLELEIKRSTTVEETHFTVAYSPVPDESAPNGIGGVLATVHEITEKVIGQRRVGILRELGARATEAKTAEQACEIAGETLAKHPKDIPFALIYLLDSDRGHAHLAASAGIRELDLLRSLNIDSDPLNSGWSVAETLRSGQITIVNDVASRFNRLPPGPWSDPPRSAAIVPILSNKPHESAGLLICGISSRISFDPLYRDFFQLTGAQISTAVANARAIEDERKRAKMLAELDRAKTAFFSNVSHEFRTPLTLLLGPPEDALANAHGILPLGAAKDLAVSHRNALRLLKLVNTLLDFARIEARRVQACYQPANLAALTSDLASNFRSACDKGGLKLIVNCPPLPEPVYVDRDMWEKIVLNLLSNAFKFTLQGEIEVCLTSSERKAVLTLRDTGVGIPADELPRMFERFHRVKESRGRTHEGTGIGLALVNELVKLHGGTAAVESELGKGSLFRIAIPLGTEHLDPQHIGKLSDLPSISMSSSAYVEEALRWLPDSEQLDSEQNNSPEPLPQSPAKSPSQRARILWADDNADMRAYVSRLLRERFEVEAVADGQAALTSARARPPDLLLADVMMPKLDGFGLLQQLRADPRLREIPVILLSARAGEESRIEGIQAGADDYLTKPFSARELMARVEVHVQMSSMRREAKLAIQASEERYRELSQMLDAEVRSRTAELEKRNADVLEKTEQLRELSQRLLSVQENERRHVAHELQDSAGNILTALGLALANIGGAAKRGRDDLERMVEECQQFLNQLAREIRTMSYLLHPPLLEEGGLPSALRWYVTGLSDRTGLDIRLGIAPGFPRLAPDMELAIFRVIQECLTNVHQHSGSQSAAARLFCESGFIHVEVRDQGKGMSPEKMAEVKSQGAGVGIRGMRERLRHFGGDLAIVSNSRGTKISARVPAPVQSSLDPSLQAESQILPTLPS